jgi:hypothetical protein
MTNPAPATSTAAPADVFVPAAAGDYVLAIGVFTVV